MKRSRRLALLLTLATTPVCVLVGYGCSDARLALHQTPTNITLEIQNYCPQSGFQYVNHFVYNASAAFDGTSWTPDTDQDGLADAFENDPANSANYATSFLSADTNGNGYSDLVKVRMGLTSAQQNVMPICRNPGVDTDHDGLSDCEEQLLGTDPTMVDSDLDGIPDGLELRFGMNPTDSNDAYTDSTGDGFTNLQKVRRGISINTFLTNDAQSLMSQYASTPITTSPGCSTLDIANIVIVPSVTGNMIQVIALEDNQAPPTNGTHNVDRRARTLSVLVPSTITTGSKVIIPDGIHGQAYGGKNQPPIQIVGGVSS